MRDRWISRIMVFIILCVRWSNSLWLQLLHAFDGGVCVLFGSSFACLLRNLWLWSKIHRNWSFVCVCNGLKGSLVAFDFVKCSMNSDKWHFGNSETCTFRLTISWLHKGKSMLIFPKEWEKNWFLVASTANVVKTIVISPVIKSDCSGRYIFFFRIDWNVAEANIGNRVNRPINAHGHMQKETVKCNLKHVFLVQCVKESEKAPFFHRRTINSEQNSIHL